MKCVNCGYDNNENACFCQGCGSKLLYNQSPLVEQIAQLLRDELFMALCILYSVSVGFSLVRVSIPAIRILMTIFLWLFFVQGRNGVIEPKYMRYISGTIFASYIIKWVSCCLVALCGIILVILSFFMDMTDFYNMLYSGIGSYIGELAGIFKFLTKTYLLILAVILIIGAGTGIFLNVFGRLSIHRFAQSVYKSIESGQEEITKCGMAQTWLMVFGIIDAIYSIFDLTTGNIAAFLSGGCLSAALIISSILVNKYFGYFK